MKNVQEKAIKCSLKTTEVYRMLMDMYSPKFDNYQGTVAQVVLRVTQTLDVLIFFMKRFA